MLPENWPTPHNRRVREATNFLENRILQMIEERRSQREQRQHASERLDLLSVLLNAQDEDGSHMSDRQVIDECIILLGAGHETTAAALSWTWYFLCQYPEEYEKVQQEVQQVLQGRRATFNDLAHLPLCLQVLEEAMRFYPPAPGIFRDSMTSPAHSMSRPSICCGNGSSMRVSVRALSSFIVVLFCSVPITSLCSKMA